jgi:O-antigen ligase
MVSKRFTASAVLIVTLVFIIPMLMNLTEDLGSGLVDRFGDINSEYGEGGRFSLIWEAVSDISESPILGSGLELRNSQTFPHNVVIEAFLTTGIFGGSLFVGLCVWAILRSMRILVFAPQRGWVALLFIFYFVFSEVSGALYLSWAFWYSFAAVMSLRVAAPLGKLRTPEHVVGRSSY